MKIVIATSRPFHLVHLGRELSEIGHDVTMFGYIPNQKIALYKPGKAKYKSLFLNFLPDSILSLQKNIHVLQHGATERLMSSVDKYVAQKMPECDAFIGLSSIALESFKVAKERYGAITICDRGSSHVLTQQETLKARKFSKLSNNYVNRELLGYATADFVTVPSIFAEKSFIENNFDAKRLFVNNYGVDLTRFHSVENIRKNKHTCHALFVGSWSYQKGCDALAKAIELDPNLYVTHIGMKGDVDFPTSKRFKTLGYIRNDELFEFYSKHDVLILPSRQDGFGMVLLEAMASGIPIIASHNTGGPDIKKVLSNSDSVILINDVSPEALLFGVENLKKSKNNTSLDLLSESEKSYFTWASYAHRYHEFLLSVSKS